MTRFKEGRKGRRRIRVDFPIYLNLAVIFLFMIVSWKSSRQTVEKDSEQQQKGYTVELVVAIEKKLLL